jgi:hypothetical protein
MSSPYHTVSNLKDALFTYLQLKTQKDAPPQNVI